MTKSSVMRNLSFALHSLIFLLFLYSGVIKLLGFDLFVNNLDKSLFFSNINTYYIAGSIVFIEFLIPILLFFDKTAKFGYSVSFLLLLAFTAYIILMFNFSPYMPCSCGGLIEILTWKQHIIFNIIFMTMLLYLIFTKPYPKPTTS